MEMEMAMATAMEEGELGNSVCSSTSTTDDDNGGCAWDDSWSPVANWGPLSVDAGDYHGLIESMMWVDDDNSMGMEEAISTMASYEPSSSTTTRASSPSGIGEDLKQQQYREDDKGLRLVHLLMAAAEALAGARGGRDLARVILVRLKEIVPPAVAGAGTNMERLAAHFTDALQRLLDGGMRAGNSSRDEQQQQQQPSDVLAAFQLLQDMSPYVKFGHFTSNQAILEAVGGDRRVHIVDYDIMEGVQWASLMQALVSPRKDGPPPPHLRITAVTRAAAGGTRRTSASTVQETGRRLAAFAESIGQPFSFGQCRLDQDEKFRPSAIKVVKGEAVVGNCVLHPPHRSSASVASFLSGMGSLGARLVTLAEEEEEIRRGDDHGDCGFIARFMDELYRYSAVWDSLEASFPVQGRARGLVEKVILGPRIAGAVGRAYRRRKEKGHGGWSDWMAAAGFHRTAVSFFNHCQARLLLGLFNDGYRVEEDESNKLVLCWKSRRLISASVWSAPPTPPPPPPPPPLPSPNSNVTCGFATGKQGAGLLCSS